MKVLLPMVNRDGTEINWLDTDNEADGIGAKFANEEAKDEIMFFFNKPPKWNE